MGLLNAIIVSLGYEPQAWLTIPIWNNIFLMAIMIWIQNINRERVISVRAIVVL